MMEISDALIEKLAGLSKLSFNEEEKKKVAADLQKMIGFVEKLNELDLSDEEPLIHMSGEINVLRADTIEGSITPEEGLKNAPATDGRFFLVPKVINKA